MHIKEKISSNRSTEKKETHFRPCVSSGFGDRMEQMGQNCYSVLACNKITLAVKFH